MLKLSQEPKNTSMIPKVMRQATPMEGESGTPWKKGPLINNTIGSRKSKATCQETTKRGNQRVHAKNVESLGPQDIPTKKTTQFS